MVKYEKIVNDTIKQPMTQNEFDAFVSVAYNAGTTAFQNSKMAKAFNENDRHTCLG
ncbi:MAG: glycoside hydrolase family protein [Burkholderiales bacterium]|nr:glycoside hydrolase family protein [Burkholderiales bacterium]